MGFVLSSGCSENFGIEMLGRAIKLCGLGFGVEGCELRVGGKLRV